MGLIKTKNRVLLFGFVESDDGFGDLIDEIALEVRGFETQIAGQLAEQIQRRTGGPVQIDRLVEVGIQTGQPGSGGRRLARSSFSGQQARATMIGEELKAGFQLGPSAGFKQLFGIGVGGERGFLKAEEGFKHRHPPVSGAAVRRN